MQFYEKLEYLMSITKTTNSALSFYTSIDASHISRLRRGQRSLPKNETYVKNMAIYFARHCTAEYQRKALLNALHINIIPSNDIQLSDWIYHWLIDNKSNDVKTIEHFLEDFSTPKLSKELLKKSDSIRVEIDSSVKETAIYYGLDGKRQAVIRFLSEVIKNDKPQELLLFSDEDMEWLTEDSSFIGKWASLMSQIISKGNKITIIHTVSRNLNDMLDAINQWMPLYMTGAIKPYYYPKKRDGVYRRTLFIAPESVAIVSSSVGNMQNKSANILLKNKEAIEAFAFEYHEYLSMCKPLMQIFTVNDKNAYLNTILEYEKEKTDTIVKTDSLSILTMPENLALKIFCQDGNKYHVQIVNYIRQRTKLFYENIQSNRFIEIVQLPDVMSIKNGEIKIDLTDLLRDESLYYSAEEYLLHLENIVQLLESNDNFHIYITDSSKSESYMVYAKEDLGTIVAKTSIPPVVLAMNESNMTAAFWDFLRNMIGDKAYNNPNNKNTAKQLREYIQKIKDSI